jgi:hypothetical protein
MADKAIKLPAQRTQKTTNYHRNMERQAKTFNLSPIDN